MKAFRPWLLGIAFALLLQGESRAAAESAATGANTLGTVLGWLAMLVFAVGVVLLVRRVTRRRDDETTSDGWSEIETDVTVEYPYCVEPQEAEEVRLDLREPQDLTPAMLGACTRGQFIEMVCGFFETVAGDAQRTLASAGGPDIYLYRPGEYRPYGYVHCEAARKNTVDVDVVQAFLATPTDDVVEKRIVVAVGRFSPEARAFATDRGVELMDGAEFIARFRALSVEKRDRIIRRLSESGELPR